MQYMAVCCTIIPIMNVKLPETHINHIIPKHQRVWRVGYVVRQCVESGVCSETVCGEWVCSETVCGEWGM